MAKIDEANVIYQRMVPCQEELGKEWRKAVIACLMNEMNISLGSAATMFNSCRIKAGGESTHRDSKKTVEAIPLEPVEKDPTFGQVFEIETEKGKLYAISKGTAEKIAARTKGKITRKPNLEGFPSE